MWPTDLWMGRKEDSVFNNAAMSASLAGEREAERQSAMRVPHLDVQHPFSPLPKLKSHLQPFLCCEDLRAHCSDIWLHHYQRPCRVGLTASFGGRNSSTPSCSLIHIHSVFAFPHLLKNIFGISHSVLSTFLNLLLLCLASYYTYWGHLWKWD